MYNDHKSVMKYGVRHRPRVFAYEHVFKRRKQESISEKRRHKRGRKHDALRSHVNDGRQCDYEQIDITLESTSDNEKQNLLIQTETEQLITKRKRTRRRNTSSNILSWSNISEDVETQMSKLKLEETVLHIEQTNDIISATPVRASAPRKRYKAKRAGSRRKVLAGRMQDAKDNTLQFASNETNLLNKDSPEERQLVIKENESLNTFKITNDTSDNELSNNDDQMSVGNEDEDITVDEDVNDDDQSGNDLCTDSVVTSHLGCGLESVSTGLGFKDTGNSFNFGKVKAKNTVKGNNSKSRQKSRGYKFKVVLPPINATGRGVVNHETRDNVCAPLLYKQAQVRRQREHSSLPILYRQITLKSFFPSRFPTKPSLKTSRKQETDQELNIKQKTNIRNNSILRKPLSERGKRSTSAVFRKFNKYMNKSIP